MCWPPAATCATPPSAPGPQKEETKVPEVPSCDSPRGGAKRPRGSGTRKKRDRPNRQLSNSGIMAPRMNTVRAAAGRSCGGAPAACPPLTLRDCHTSLGAAARGSLARPVRAGGGYVQSLLWCVLVPCCSVVCRVVTCATFARRFVNPLSLPS